MKQDACWILRCEHKLLVLTGNDSQKEKFFSVINDGKLAAFALTEPEAGSDAQALSCSAVKEGDTYILNGTKNWITNQNVKLYHTKE